jgi:FlaA1/EpsC-like NDP-sugar epimerase
MKQYIKKFNIVPSWVILLLDISFVFLAALFAVIIRDNFHIPAHFSRYVYLYVPLAIAAVRVLFFLLFGTQKIVVRFTNTKDVIRIFISCLSASLFLGLMNLVSFIFVKQFVVPTSVIIMEFFITTVIMVFYRFAFKIVYLEKVNPTKLKKNIVIFGAGEAGITTKRALDRDTESKYNVSAFFDEDPKKIGKNVESVFVFGYKDMADYFSKNDIAFLIIAIQNLPPYKINEVYRNCFAI